jgi:predicted Zn-dependent protease
MALRYVLLFLLGLAPAVLAEGLPELGDASQSSFSSLDERRMGEQVMREVRADPGYYDDAEATEYLSALGNRLVTQGTDVRQQFRFFFMNDSQINAFALPGGFVGVNTGLILAAQSESEAAGVLGHEIAHVTQRHIARMMEQQKTSTVVSLAAIALAALAARSSSEVGAAAAAVGQAGAIQNLLNFTREHEREADRVGLQILEKAGYDPRAMAVFFERLQRATRLSEGVAPNVYLRTHPLTHERIADIQNRVEQMPYRQVRDSLDFHLVRAKLRAELDPPREARTFFEQSLTEKRYLSEAAAHYGLAISLVRLKDYSGAKKEFEAVQRTAGTHAMVDTLGCRIRREAKDTEAALACYAQAIKAYPKHRALIYDYAEALLQAGRPDMALDVAGRGLQQDGDDPKLYLLQARSYALQGKQLAQHRATGEAYARMGNVRGAVEQMQIALKSGDGDFYQLSSTEARLRELRKIADAERKEQRR